MIAKGKKVRDRLIELIMECSTYTPEYSKHARLHAEYLAQHLLNNNVIVLPCKLNSEVYDITEFIDKCPCPDMYEFSTDDILLSRCRTTKEMIFSIDGIDYTFDEFGVRVFLTEDKAYEKIRELERSENGT
jgi:hypothetical protein